MTALTRLLSSSPFRLTMAYIGVFVLAAALIVGFIAWRANELLTTKVMETLNAEVQGLREQFQAGGPARLRDIITERASEPGSSLYLLVDAGDRKIAGNLSRVPTELRESGRGGIFRYVRASDAAARTERLGVGVSFAVPGGFILIVGRDIEDQRRFADTMWLVALWSVGLMSVLGIGAGLLVSRSVLRRIETVTEASRTIMAGDLSKRIPLDGSGDELDRLSQNLNAMLARIEELMGALREVSDNIAHDLKTPLNRLRNRAEAALRDPDGAAGYRDGLVKTIEEADELIKTFNSLLLIARLEGGAVAESMAPVDPASIIEDVAELYEPVAEQMGLRLEIATAKGLIVVANRELVGQAIANLVDNAIKYAADRAPADGSAPQTITISLAPVGDAVEFTIADRGPGVAPKDRERALQRFVRLEKSRSRPGSGLGLSLVAAVARLHGGSIRLEDNAPGLKAVLTLPKGGPHVSAGAGIASPLRRDGEAP
ncbi:MAG TPA: HAMP domain-containing sensor histidine kinase [Hyphomicrobiaceae bacterium]|nr:HAMP domain-containing sensor histidine kinase [Hyphomicrobiaceae bacterium]